MKTQDIFLQETEKLKTQLKEQQSHIKEQQSHIENQRLHIKDQEEKIQSLELLNQWYLEQLRLNRVKKFGSS